MTLVVGTYAAMGFELTTSHWWLQWPLGEGFHLIIIKVLDRFCAGGGLEFEHSTFGSWAYSHNHYARVTSYKENYQHKVMLRRLVEN